MERYFTVLDELRTEPSSDLAKLETVATRTQLNAARTLVRTHRDRDQRQVGETRIAESTVQSINLDNSDPAAGKVPTVVVDVCWDVSKVDVLDEDGKSIISPDRPDTGWTRYTVANYDYTANPTGGWRVANGQDLKQDAQQTAEYHDVLQQEADLTAGHGVLRATGFVAVSASDPDELERAVAAVEQAAIQASCETRRLWGQQAQGFVAAALPLARPV
jgi:hypothetical protein